MAGTDYMDVDGSSGQLQRWLKALRPYTHRLRPSGHPAHTALLVLDMQRFFLEPRFHACLPAGRVILPAVNSMIQAFHQQGRPVLFTRHAYAAASEHGRMAGWWGSQVREGSEAAHLSPLLRVGPGDTVLRKTRYSAFLHTDLEARLKRRGVDTLVLCGVMTHLCVESTARDAFQRGFFVHVVADACASANEDLHLGALRGLAHGFAQVSATTTVLTWLQRAPPTSHTDPAGVPSPTPALDLAVVGGGPAGLMAALQGVRQGLRVALWEGAELGGLLRQAHRVENAPGHPPQPGARLVERLLAQVEAAGITPRREWIRTITRRDDTFLLHDARGAEHPCRAVVLASGTRARRAGFPGEDSPQVFHGVQELLQRSPQRTGAVAVVGGGDAALDQACQLQQRGYEVQVWLRGEQPRALPLLLERARRLGVVLRRRRPLLRAHAVAEGICLQWEGDQERCATFQAVLVAVGREPQTPALLEWSAQGARPVPWLPGEPSPWPRLLLAGDVTRGRYRQMASATGDGVRAAMAAARLLEGRRV